LTGSLFRFLGLRALLVKSLLYLQVLVAFGVPNKVHQVEVRCVVDRLAYLCYVVVVQPVHSWVAHSWYSPARMDRSRVKNVQIDLNVTSDLEIDEDFETRRSLK